MIPPVSPPNWSFDEARKWLIRHPDALEPGLRLLDRGLDLGGGLSVPLCGVDPLGHPCLVVHSETFSAHFFDQLLEIVARLVGDGARFQPLFPRPTEPRVFLLAAHFDRDVRLRLALLGQAFPLHTFLLLPPLREETAPQLVPELMDLGLESTELLAELPEPLQAHATRLLGACRSMRPGVRIHGNRWPLVLHGSQGPAATLFWEKQELWFATSKECAGGAPLKLENDGAVDCAIDLLMRGQSKDVSPAA